MIIDVTGVIKDFSGDPAKRQIRIGDELLSTDEDLLLRSAIFQALDNQAMHEPPRSADDKERSFRICCHLMSRDEIEISDTDAAFIKRCSGYVNPPLLHGRICEAISAATLAFTDGDTTP